MSKNKNIIDRIICALPFAFYFSVLTVIAIARAFNLIDMRSNAIDIVTTSTFAYALICFPKHIRMAIENVGKHFIKSTKLSYFVVLLVICLITSGLFCVFNLSLSDNIEDALCVFSFALLIIEMAKNNTEDNEEHDGYKFLGVLGIILLALFLIVGVPLIINECYKANCGYITVWDGADVLGYYGAILGSIIAVATLGITIIFTKKQIQRESFVKTETEKWSKIEAVFADVLDEINPIRVMKDTMDNGITDPGKTMNILQKYQLTCEMAEDKLKVCVSSKDYAYVKTLVDSTVSAAKQFVATSQKQIDEYSKLLSLKRREIAEKAIKLQKQYPGSFSQTDMAEHSEVLEKTKDVKFDNIKNALCQFINETVAINNTVYKPLLKSKNKVFEEINADIQRRADEILRLRRK